MFLGSISCEEALEHVYNLVRSNDPFSLKLDLILVDVLGWIVFVSQPHDYIAYYIIPIAFLLFKMTSKFIFSFRLIDFNP